MCLKGGKTIFSCIYEICDAKAPYKRARMDKITKSGIISSFDIKNLESSADARPMELAGRAKPRIFRNRADYFDSDKVSSHHAIIPTSSAAVFVRESRQGV